MLRRVFNERVKCYINDRVKGTANVYCSPIYDLLNTAARFDLLQQVLEMSLGYSRQSTKAQWSKVVWQKGWELDDLYWRSAVIVHKSNDILRNTVGKSQYLTWWNLSDNSPQLQRMCETMASLPY